MLYLFPNSAKKKIIFKIVPYCQGAGLSGETLSTPPPHCLHSPPHKGSCISIIAQAIAQAPYACVRSPRVCTEQLAGLSHVHIFNLSRPCEISLLRAIPTCIPTWGFCGPLSHHTQGHPAILFLPIWQVKMTSYRFNLCFFSGDKFEPVCFWVSCNALSQHLSIFLCCSYWFAGVSLVDKILDCQ